METSRDNENALTQPPADGSLTRAALAGGIWTTVGNAATKGLGGVKTVVLARLLRPGDFGLMGLALAVIGSANLFSNPGIYTALIQKKQLEDSDLNAGWWIHLSRGIFLFLVLFPSAGLLADFFHEPRLAGVLRAVSLGLLMDGMQSIGLVRLNRALDFRRLTILNQAANITGLAVALLLAWTLQSVWALVGAHLAQSAVLCAASYLLAPFRPRIQLNWARMQELLRFGRYVFVAIMFFVVVMRGNEFLVGRIAGVERYGYYALALSLVGTLSALLDQLVNSVAFPALSRLNGRDERFASAFLRVFRMALLGGAPLFLGLAVFGRDLVALGLGYKWSPMVAPLVWLCLFGFFQSLTSTFQVAHSALGEVARQARLRFFEMAVYLAGVIPMIHRWGASGAACWLAVVGATGFCIHVCGTVPYLKAIFRQASVLVAGYWPLFAAQLLLAFLQWGHPGAWPRLGTLGALYAAFVILFAGWKERELLVDLFHNGLKIGSSST